MKKHTLISQNTQVALITGASRRIGAAIAKTLHDAGFSLALHCNQSEEQALALAKSFNAVRENSASVFSADFSKPYTDYLLKAVMERMGSLHVLVNNASLFIRDTDPNFDWDHLFNINVQWPFALSQAFIKQLDTEEGVIINITDIHARHPLKGYSAYCQTKAALSLQTKSFAKEYAPHVRVNAVAPGAIMWPEQANALTEGDKEKIIQKTPLKRHGSPVYIAEAVLALIRNSFITGQTLAVDGGRSLD